MCLIKVTLIFLKNNIILSKKKYKDWHDAQEEYCDNYVTSMHNLSYSDVISYLSSDYGKNDKKMAIFQ